VAGKPVRMRDAFTLRYIDIVLPSVSISTALAVVQLV
jgi:hypothetical protein